MTSAVRFLFTASIVAARSGPAASAVDCLHEEGRVVGREHALVVLEQDLVVALDLRVGGEDDRDVGLPAGQHLVALVDVDGHELLELQAVDLLEAQQAVQARAALGRAVEGELAGLGLEVGDLRDPELVGLLLEQPDLVGRRERRRREGLDALLGQARLDLLVGLGPRRSGCPWPGPSGTTAARCRCTPGSRRSGRSSTAFSAVFSSPRLSAFLTV